MIDLSHIAFEGIQAPSRSGRSRLRAEPSGAQPEHEGERDPLAVWLLGQAGLQAEAYRSSALNRRVSACLRLLRVPSPEAAQELVSRRPELLSGALDSMLIGVTEFFRDPIVFQHLYSQVVPQLHGLRRPLRCCSVGASHGQELISFAILLAEAGLLEGATLLGLDCRPEAVAKARRGAYTHAELANVPAYLREKYFERRGAAWNVSPRFAACLRWEKESVFALAPDEWDVILFRNVAIYLELSHAVAAWTRLCERLRLGGILVTGKAERPPANLPLRRLARSVYRKSDAPCP
ncbi:hypothetical protein DB347_05400 [Opitutaceae bacterium EW11]|nr:hypothetical protein DB347_05400 [Opitutaceae bacterium EW11]